MLKKILFLGLIILAGLLLILAFNYLRFAAPEQASPFATEHLYTAPEALSGALMFETISHKKEMLDVDAFKGMKAYLDSVFPLVDSLLSLKAINTHSLLYHWPGKAQDREAVVLMAHMDVVPVEYATRGEWVEPPFSGNLRDGYIYGRGALDDKGSYVSILNAVHLLLEKGHQPESDVYLCFGHDEEIGGDEGAAEVVAYLKKQGIRARLVLDEGGLLTQNIVPGISRPVALVGISEKGYVSLDFTVNIEGGHSSMPAQKTAVSTLNEAIQKLEENPLPSRLSAPLKGFIEHVGPHLPFTQKLAFSNPWLFKPLIFNVYEQNPSSAALVKTTQVTTILQAGIKDNVVPSRAWATVNYRLLPGDTPEEIMARARELINDTLVRIEIHDDFRIPASPVSDYRDPRFTYLQRCINTVFPEALVSPYLVLGATDGRHFYEISDHVYRFLPIRMLPEDIPRLHGVNERISLEDYNASVQFYHTFLKNLEQLKHP